MENFDKIIKQKAEQFEVPYNEAHWAEMDAKLNAIRAIKIKQAILGSVAAIAIVAISSYFIFSNNDPATIINDNIIVNDDTTEIIVNNVEPEKENLITTNNINPKQENSIKVDDNTGPINNEIPLLENELKVITEENNTNDNIFLETVKSEEKNTVKEINNIINTEFIVYNNRACLGEEVSFESLENNSLFSYNWDFGDGTVSYKVNPKHTYTESRTYTVSLTMIDKETGKKYTSTQNDVVKVLPSPKANFSYTEVSIEHNDNKLKHPYTTFNVNGIDKKNTYKWVFGNGKTSTSTNGKTIFKKQGNYTTTLIVQDLNGCVNVTEETIKIKTGIDLFAPNAFTPNNSGGNETFIPKALLGWDVQFEMTIIDRSGKLIYKTSDKNEPWNGKVNNSGQVLSDGVYLWKVATYDAEGVPHYHYGQINLLK